MSKPAVEWAKSHALNRTRRAVLMALARRHNARTGLCCPSLETLSDDTGYGDRAVRYAITDLVALGLISKGRARRKSGKAKGAWDHTSYGLNLGFKGASDRGYHRQTVPVVHRHGGAGSHYRHEVPTNNRDIGPSETPSADVVFFEKRAAK